MAWVRIHDGALTHPKVVGLSDSAFRLWVWGLSYCQQHLTDGWIPPAALPAKCKPDGLVSARLWHYATQGGFDVHDYLEWNDSRETVQKKRASLRDRVTRYRGADTTRDRNASATSGVVITPQFDHLEEEKKEPPARFDDFWAVYPRKVGKAAAEREWQRLKPNTELLGRMVAALVRQTRTPQWTKDNGEFIPHARTWLHQQRWNDEVAVPKQAGSYQPSAHADYDTWRAVCHELHGGECGNYQAHQFRLMKEQQVAS